MSNIDEGADNARASLHATHAEAGRARSCQRSVHQPCSRRMGGTYKEPHDFENAARVEMGTYLLPVSPRPTWISAVLDLASAQAARARADSVGAGAGEQSGHARRRRAASLTECVVRAAKARRQDAWGEERKSVGTDIVPSGEKQPTRPRDRVLSPSISPPRSHSPRLVWSPRAFAILVSLTNGHATLHPAKARIAAPASRPYTHPKPLLAARWLS
jgi:hypothetical protein